MDALPGSNDSRSTILEDSILVEEPSQKSGSDLESDETRKSRHVDFVLPAGEASTPPSPIRRLSRRSAARSGPPRGESASNAVTSSVQTVIEAYERGKQFGSTNLHYAQREGRRPSARRTVSSDSYAQPTVEEPSNSSPSSPEPRASPVDFEVRRRPQARNAASRDSYARTMPEAERTESFDFVERRRASPQSVPARPSGVRITPSYRDEPHYDHDPYYSDDDYDYYDKYHRRPSPHHFSEPASRLHRRRSQDSRRTPMFNDYHTGARERWAEHPAYPSHSSGLYRSRSKPSAPAPTLTGNIYDVLDEDGYSFARHGINDDQTFYRGRSRGRDRLGDRYGDSLQHRLSPVPQINVYNRMQQEDPPYPPYPPYPPRSSPVRRSSLHHYPEARQRDGLAIVPTQAAGFGHEKVLANGYERKQLEAKAAAQAIEAKLKLEALEEEAKREDEVVANDEREKRIPSSAYDFILPERYFSAKDGNAPREDNTPNSNLPGSKKVIPNDVKVMPIMDSRWELASSGGCSAVLETTMGHTVPLTFVWAHINKLAHGFADIAKVVSLLPSLPAGAKIQVPEFLDEVKSKHEHLRNGGLELAPSAVFCSPALLRSTPLYFAACETLHVGNLPGQVQRASNTHKSRPLLKALKPGADIARERKQVLSQAASSKGKCVYVSQTWLLLVGDSCLITASSRSEHDMLPQIGKQKAITPVPIPNPNSSDTRSGKVKLTYSARSWMVAASECRSWAALWASFLEAFAERAHGLTITHGSKPITSKTWKLLQAEERSSVLELCIAKGEAQRLPPSMEALQFDFDTHIQKTDVDRVWPIDRKDSQNSEQKERPLDDVGPLLSVFNLSKPVGSDGEIADEMHKLLSNHPVLALRNAYRYWDDWKEGTTTPHDFDSILDYCKPSPSEGRQSSGYIEFGANIKHLYDFFWPREANHEMLFKFRVMLASTMLDVRDSHISYDAEYMYDWPLVNGLLRRALSTAAWITVTFVDDPGSFPNLLPPDFFKAWLHLHSAIALLSRPSLRFDQYSKNHEAAIRHFELFATCLETADEALVKQLRTADIKQHECAQANGVFWLSLSRIMSEEVGTSTEIADTYRQYLADLDFEITNKPTDHKLQERLRMFREEAEGIRDILDRNLSAIDKAREGMGIVDANQVRPPLGGDDPRFKLSREMLLRLKNKRDRFNELAEVASVLQSRAEREVGEVKNDQEKAIYLFTIVTVIFLPLSFVSSLFGMNTSDIRNIDESQWIFWVVAIPVTVLVIGACLWFTGGFRLGLGWPQTSSRRNVHTSAPPSYQDAVGEYYEIGEEKRRPDRDIDALDGRILRHNPRSGLQQYSTAGEGFGRRRNPVRRRTRDDYA